MKEISRFNEPEESPGFLLWQVSMKWRREIEAALAPLNLTHPQFVLLAGLCWLTREHQYVTQSELARHSGTDVNMTSQVLRSLEEKGYIKRHRREGDERSKFPKLTPLGVKIIEKAIPIVEKVDEIFFGKLESKTIGILQQLNNY